MSASRVLMALTPDAAASAVERMPWESIIPPAITSARHTSATTMVAIGSLLPSFRSLHYGVKYVEAVTPLGVLSTARLVVPAPAAGSR